MDINLKVKPNIVIRSFYLFFIIASMQLGVGTMGVPSYIFKYAKQDSWISIVISLLAMLMVVSVMITILRQYENADIFGIQVDLFGKWIGKLLGTVYIVYFGWVLLSIMLTYNEVVQVFLYPTIPSFVLGLMFIFLTIYCVLGGLRVIVGACFLFLFSSQILLLFLYDPFTRMDWNHFLPMFQTSIPDLLRGARETTYTVGGFEILFLLYPFMQNKKQVKLPVFLALTYTIFIVFIITMISIGYYSLGRLEHNEWAVLSLFKTVSYPFIERLDYIVVIIWLLVVIPNFLLLMWGMTSGMKRLYNTPEKVSLVVLSGIILVIVSFITDDQLILQITDYVAKVGFWIIFVYPLILLPLVFIKKKWRKQKERKLS